MNILLFAGSAFSQMAGSSKANTLKCHEMKWHSVELNFIGSGETKHNEKRKREYKANLNETDNYAQHFAGKPVGR